MKKCLLPVGTIITAACLTMLPAAGEPVEERWDLRLENFFKGGTKPLWLYGRTRDGKWISVAGSSRDDERGSRKKSYNRSWYYGDLSGVPLRDGKLKGRFVLHVTPDLWVPLDHKPYTVEFEVDAKRKGRDEIGGRWKLVAKDTTDSSADFGTSGPLVGSMEKADQAPLPDPVTIRCNMHGALVGGDPRFGDRCMVLQLGFSDGKFKSGIHASLSKKYEVYGRRTFDPETCTLTATPDRVHGRVVVPATTLDLVPATYTYEIDGRPIEGYIVGLYHLTVKVEGGPDIFIDGSFDGTWTEGIEILENEDAGPWHTDVTGFNPPAPGEHPRLLLRKADLPALRKRARTPEGRAILQRLRQQLDGADGESMPPVFNDSTKAYERNTKKNPLPLGAYTISHAAGYGLLYQLTGDEKHAAFGKQCFEKALGGVRDRDDRYSFREPGGALRAGPSLGWYAVGYDLCYDGWDRKTRERFGRALWEFEQGEGTKAYDLESLARGTMPPGSNHFGMQVGGASLVLMALEGEPFVDADRMDLLLRLAGNSTIRNLSEGFGDGGIFAEGDGTGSMSSHIVYLSSLAAWRNARGMDFVNVDRPNARMAALKWMFQTVYRGGRPQIWPIRGAYGHNVWDRQGLSGAGYFSIGLGAVTEPDQAAMKWCYENFLMVPDEAAGGPYDTVGPYPHHSVSAFLNWPVNITAMAPGSVWPRVYRDTSCDFFCWRNRWRDENDTVVTVLLSRTQGYMSAKTDRQFMIHSHGRRLRWGTAAEGPVQHWGSSPRGETSSLTMADGTAFAVDFTGTSGADVMLVTTGEAEGTSVHLGGRQLTFIFPENDAPPALISRDGSVMIGRQCVRLNGPHIEFSKQGR